MVDRLLVVEKSLASRLNYHIHVVLVQQPKDRKNPNHTLMINSRDLFEVNTSIVVDRHNDLMLMVGVAVAVGNNSTFSRSIVE